VNSDARNPDDYCYRHPDRPSFVLCERCGRTICLECQNHVGGKVLCPDDARTSNVTMMPVNARPPKATRIRRQSLLARIPDSWPLVSTVIIAVLLVVFIADTIARGAIGSVMVVVATSPLTMPWTLVTSMFYPNNILGLVISGLNLFLLGRILEPHFGRFRYLLLYLVSGFGGAVFAFLLDGYSVSPYGAISGLLAALAITARRMGANLVYIYISCAISALLAIYLGGWQAFLGGFVAGGLIGWIYHLEENDHRARRAILLVIAVGGVLVVAAFARALFFYLAR
jgi:membrane associated rhomboid family serine protease